MPRSSNQKLKILYIAKYLLEKSDVNHPVGVARLIEELEAHGITAERKSIYDDVEALRLFGMDIEQIKGKSAGYYVASRNFELPELKLLVDSVQSSKFITHRKTLSLIRKIESLTSVHEAQLLQRQVYVRNRVKSMNESVYYNVDEISTAISDDREIRFRYYEYGINKERRFRKNGAYYTVSPFALMWDDENYYMLGYDVEAEILKHFRVDKMTAISDTGTTRRGKYAFADVDMSDYSKKVFGMFTGKQETVKMRFANKLVGAVIDRFGSESIIIAADENHFTVSAGVAVSPQFFAWLFGFGCDAEVLAPQWVREAIAADAAAISKMYEG